MTAYFVSGPLRGSPILTSPVATGEVASMRADGGARGLRALLSLWMVYGLRPWRPLHRLRGPPPPLWQGRLWDITA